MKKITFASSIAFLVAIAAVFASMTSYAGSLPPTIPFILARLFIYFYLFIISKILDLNNNKKKEIGQKVSLNYPINHVKHFYYELQIQQQFQLL